MVGWGRSGGGRG